MNRTITIGSLFLLCGGFVLIVTLGISIYAGNIIFNEIDDLAARNEFQRDSKNITNITNRFIFVNKYQSDSQMRESLKEFSDNGIIAIYDKNIGLVWKQHDTDEEINTRINYSSDIFSVKVGDSYIASIPIYLDAQTSSLQDYAVEYFSEPTESLESNELIGYAIVAKPYMRSLETDARNRYIFVGTLIIASMISLLTFIIYRMIGRPLALLKTRISSNDIKGIKTDFHRSLISTNEIDSLTGAYLDQHQSISMANENLEEQVVQRTLELDEALKKKEIAEALRLSLFKNISHDLRTPLTANIGYLDVALEELNDPHGDKNLMQHALMGARGRAKELDKEVNALLQFAVFEDDLTKIDYRTVDLKTMLVEALKETEHDKTVAGNTITFTYTGRTSMKTAERPVRHVINTLLSNASRYCKNGYIAVHCRVEQGLWLTISDTGPGVPLEERERIFEPNFRSAFIEADGPKGMGIGLSMAKNWVDHLGGEISLVPDEELTIFSVTIPEHT